MIAKFKYISIVFVFMTGFSLSGAYAFESHKIANSSQKYTFSLEGGTADGDAEAERFGGSFRVNFDRTLIEGRNWLGRAYLEASLSYWDGEAGRTNNDSLVDFGLTPVLRVQKKGEGFQPFAEFGIGAHLHTEDSIGDENFDIPFAFGSHLGLGFRFGPRSKYEFLYRFQHLSNASLGDDNPGINFHVLSLGVHF